MTDRKKDGLFSLKDYYDMRAMIKESESMERRVEYLDGKMKEASSPLISEAPSHGGKINDVGDAIVNIAQLRKAYIVAIGKVAEEQARREMVVLQLPVRYRELVRLRYVYAKSWEEISDIIHYSKRQMFRLHKEIVLQKQ